MSPKLSVIIPCFNHGAFIDEAVQSALAQTHEELEVVVVDDGSIDPATVALLSDPPWPRTRVFRTHNRGPAAARNTGIEAATGRYILPLDADDRIGPRYAEQAIAVLESDPGVRLVYCQARLFGAREGAWALPPFSPDLMLVVNHIFCSGVFARASWERAGGYRPSMRAGFEDWDFWLSLLDQGGRAYQLPEAHFFYRIVPTSRTQRMGLLANLRLRLRLLARHKRRYLTQPLGLLRGALLAARLGSFRP